MNVRSPWSVTAAIAATACALAAPLAEAAPVFNFTDFSTACGGAQLTCVGNTAAVGSVLRLTPTASSYASGAAYSTTPVALGAGATFSSTFQFRFTQPGGIDPADGIVFVLANNTTGLGGAGFGIGYSGLSGGSLGIEFDTFNNGASTNDISSNHVAIDENGQLNNFAAANPYGVGNCQTDPNSYQQAGCMSNGDVWSVVIGYDGTTQLLSVTVQDGSAAPQSIISDFSVDLPALLGSSSAYVGFTSATGAGYENHDILGWQLASDTSLSNPPPVTPPSGTVPEPLSVTLFGIGVVGLAAARRRR
jgi:hypothetical protein